MKNKDIVWFDVETTGLNKAEDRIIEICMIKTDHKGERKDYYYSLVNPGSGVEMSTQAEEKHGISLESLSDKPTFYEISKDVYSFIKDCDLGGYNALRFDIPILIEELMRCNIIFNHRNANIIDPFLIYTKYESRDLESAYKKYTGKVLEGAHAAETDIIATMEIFKSQLELYEMPTTASEIDDEVNDRKNQIDLDGKLKLDEINGKRIIVFNFGKWKGTPFLEVYNKNPGYIDWILNGNFSKELKIIINKIVKQIKSKNDS